MVIWCYYLWKRTNKFCANSLFNLLMDSLEFLGWRWIKFIWRDAHVDIKRRLKAFEIFEDGTMLWWHLWFFFNHVLFMENSALFPLVILLGLEDHYSEMPFFYFIMSKNSISCWWGWSRIWWILWHPHFCSSTRQLYWVKSWLVQGLATCTWWGDWLTIV